MSKVFACGALLACSLSGCFDAFAQTPLSGIVTDPQGKTVEGAVLVLQNGPVPDTKTTTGNEGRFRFPDLPAGRYRLIAEYSGFASVARTVSVAPASSASLDIQFREVSAHKDSIVITAKSLEPAIDLRNAGQARESPGGTQSKLG